MAIKLLDLETIESFRELQTPDDPMFVRTLLTKFMAPIPKHLEEIRRAIETGNSHELSECAHAILSGCTNVGATAIVELCTHLEQLGEKGTVQGAMELYVKLVPLCETLRAEVYSLPEFAQAA